MYASKDVRCYLSSFLIILQVAFMGRVGGDNDAYVDRGLFALDAPEILIVNEPFTVLFAYMSEASGLPLPNFYAIVTCGLLLFALSKSSNRAIYLIAYTIFIVPIGIGYLRQGLAVPLLLLMMLTSRPAGQFCSSLFSVIAHPSAIVSVGLFYGHKLLIHGSIITKIILIIFGIVLIEYVGGAFSHYINHYNINSDIQSSGYLFRLAFYILVITLITLNRNITLSQSRTTILVQIWALPLLSLILFFLAGSTAADRILVLVVPSILYFTMVDEKSSNTKYIVIISVAYLIAWLFLSPHAQANWQYETFIRIL
jgi:hypothetical protein